MAFKVSMIQGESCDKCKSMDGDVVCVSYTNRQQDEHAVIFIHEQCLQKAVDNAKKTLETKAKVG